MYSIFREGDKTGNVKVKSNVIHFDNGVARGVDANTANILDRLGYKVVKEDDQSQQDDVKVVEEEKQEQDLLDEENNVEMTLDEFKEFHHNKQKAELRKGAVPKEVINYVIDNPEEFTKGTVNEAEKFVLEGGYDNAE